MGNEELEPTHGEEPTTLRYGATRSFTMGRDVLHGCCLLVLVRVRAHSQAPQRRHRRPQPGCAKRAPARWPHATAPAVSPWNRTSSIAGEDWSKRRRRDGGSTRRRTRVFLKIPEHPFLYYNCGSVSAGYYKLYLDRMTLKMKKQLVGSRISKPPALRVSSSTPLIYPAHRSRAAVSIFWPRLFNTRPIMFVSHFHPGLLSPFLDCN